MLYNYHGVLDDKLNCFMDASIILERHVIPETNFMQSVFTAVYSLSQIFFFLTRLNHAP